MQTVPDLEVRSISPLAFMARQRNDIATEQARYHQIVDIAKANHLLKSPQQMGASWNIALYENEHKNYKAVVNNTTDCLDAMGQIWGDNSAALIEPLRVRAKAYTQLDQCKPANADFNRALGIALETKHDVEVVYAEQKTLLESTLQRTALRELEAKMATYRQPRLKTKQVRAE